jgi:ATP-dependent metalloprotease FtsH
VLPVLLVFGALVMFGLLTGPSEQARAPSYSEFLGQLEGGQVRAVTIKPQRNSVEVETRSGETYKTAYPNNTETGLIRKLREREVAIDVKPKSAGWAGYLVYVAPIALLAVFWIVLLRRSKAASGGLTRMTRSPARRADADPPTVTFRDVAGVDEAVEELQEIKEFLENPKKFQALGARIPKGVLLYGPPGTGKTLLARAVAGEAGVPFFSISGSDFVEMFVGVGASRVRDLFEQAKQNSPCIIFMDEIDAVGRHRGAGLGGGHDEREQTLNQLLVEMDGFEMKDNIILIAATNRPDILDPALLRPGRFDRQIVVDRPDRKGRVKILEVHTRGKPLAKAIDLDTLAGQTPGFTGADLQNLVNEAALLAARQSKREIDHLQLEEGIMRVIAGPEKKTRVMSGKERRVTAFHEMGHALVAHFLENTDPVHKISVISRGQALGYTISLPTEDKFLTTRAGAGGHDGDDAGRPGSRGARFRRGDHRGVERPRKGDRHGQADGDALRHVREARPQGVRPRPRPAVPGPAYAGPHGLLKRPDEADRRRGQTGHRNGSRHGAPSTRRPPRPARLSCRDPAAARDDRARAVHPTACGQDRGGGLRRRGAAGPPPHPAHKAPPPPRTARYTAPDGRTASAGADSGLSSTALGRAARARRGGTSSQRARPGHGPPPARASGRPGASAGARTNARRVLALRC